MQHFGVATLCHISRSQEQRNMACDVLDIICFNSPFMSDVTFKVSVEYISSSQHINENSREKNIDARV